MIARWSHIAAIAFSRRLSAAIFRLQEAPIPDMSILVVRMVAFIFTISTQRSLVRSMSMRRRAIRGPGFHVATITPMNMTATQGLGRRASEMQVGILMPLYWLVRHSFHLRPWFFFRPWLLVHAGIQLSNKSTATSWNGWGMSTGTCTIHSWNDDASDDEGEPKMGQRVSHTLEHDDALYGHPRNTTNQAQSRVRSRRVVVPDDDDYAPETNAW